MSICEGLIKFKRANTLSTCLFGRGRELMKSVNLINSLTYPISTQRGKCIKLLPKRLILRPFMSGTVQKTSRTNFLSSIHRKSKFEKPFSLSLQVVAHSFHKLRLSGFQYIQTGTLIFLTHTSIRPSFQVVSAILYAS